MNAFAIAGLFVLIPCITVGVFTLLKGRRKIHFVWSGFCFSIALWGFGMYKIGTTVNIDSSFFWWRVAEIGVILIPLFLTHFVITFLALKRKILVVLFYSFSAFLIFCDLFTKYFINDLYFAFNQFYYISATRLYTIFISVFVLSVIYVIFELARAHKKSTSTVKYQIKYLILAFTVGFSGGITSYLPVYKINIYPVWNATIFISAIMATYAILRYRLMDLRVVARKAVIYFISAAFVYGMFYLVAWTYNQFFGSIYAKNAYISGFIIAPLFVLIFVWLNDKIRGIANKYLFFSLYSSQETMAKLTDELTNSIDLSKIVDSIANSIKNAMQLDRAGILLIDQNDGTIKYKIAKVIGFNENNGISLVQDNFLTQHLEKTQKPLVRDELQMIAKDLSDPNERQGFFQLAENMKHIEASLCLPMIISNKLIGIIVLGSKISGDAYTNEDLTLLNTLSKQAAIAVDNARLYREVQDFSQTLQQKVDEQTKELREQKDKIEKAFEVEKQAHEIEKHANEELKHLDENKTDFMLITQHHLRTPLSVNNGFIDLMLAGTFGKIPAKIKSVILRLSESTQKEIDVVNELLDVSSYQIGKEVIHFHPIDFEALMEETLKDLTAEAEAKGIYLKYEKRGEIPKVPADRMKLKLVFTNVIDNCIKYTTKGGVTVAMEIKNDKLLISVTDTGIGLSNEVIQNLFKQSFHRGEQAKKLFAVGKGLGLYLSGKIIEGHHGRIWAESRGDGNGSGFYIELPVKQNQEINQPLKVETEVNINVK
ncbi:MAG: GAF domain-containing protein [Parcubacteria group bacterium]|nr:GAF domain-containing protein [Parcubacteria group bacterium]